MVRTEVVIKRCSGKTAFLKFKIVKKIHLKSRKYICEIHRKESIIKLRFKFLACNLTEKQTPSREFVKDFAWILKTLFPE